MEDNDVLTDITHLLIKFARRFCTIFTLSILALTLASAAVAYFAPTALALSPLFSPTGEALPYNALFQMGLFALLASLVETVFLSSSFLSSLRFLWRILAVIFCSILSACLLAIVFRWIPLDNAEAWRYFILSLMLGFVLCFVILYSKTKREGRKYQRLLDAYKAGQR
jgi:hypothetical protein